jgi:hypothetical protein
MNRLLACLVMLLVVPCGARSEPLGRLFYTPAQRTQLDTARAQRTASPLAETPAAETPPAPPALTFNGVVRRSDGKSTIWINNRAVGDGESLSGVAVVGRVRPDGAIRLNMLQSKAGVDLKVGQTLDVDSGSVAENYARPQPSVQSGASTAAPPEHETAYSSWKRRRLTAGRGQDTRADSADRAIPETAESAPR